MEELIFNYLKKNLEIKLTVHKTYYVSAGNSLIDAIDIKLLLEDVLISKKSIQVTEEIDC